MRYRSRPKAPRGFPEASFGGTVVQEVLVESPPDTPYRLAQYWYDRMREAGGEPPNVKAGLKPASILLQKHTPDKLARMVDNLAQLTARTGVWVSLWRLLK